MGVREEGDSLMLNHIEKPCSRISQECRACLFPRLPCNISACASHLAGPRFNRGLTPLTPPSEGGIGDGRVRWWTVTDHFHVRLLHSCNELTCADVEALEPDALETDACGRRQALRFNLGCLVCGIVALPGQ